MGKYKVTKCQINQGKCILTIEPTCLYGVVLVEDTKKFIDLIDRWDDTRIKVNVPSNTYETALMVARGCRYGRNGITPKKVIFHDPATIVFWNDGTKTVVKCQEGDTYSEEMGLALCFSKKMLGNRSNFNNEFKKWILEE